MNSRWYLKSLLALPLMLIAGMSFAAQEPQSSILTDGGILQIPVVSYLTRQFLFSGRYAVKLTRTEMQIDHMAVNSRCPMRRRNCHLSLAYSTPILGSMGSGLFELPIAGAEGISSPWTTASFGDYITHFSQTQTFSPDLRLMATLKF